MNIKNPIDLKTQQKRQCCNDCKNGNIGRNEPCKAKLLLNKMKNKPTKED